jgi:deoxyadenosine/deoxycytidine kinase
MSESNLQESCLSRGIKRCGFHICVLGTIGAGKTTLAKALQKVIQEKEGRCEGFWEPVAENELLPLYYENPERYAFPMQVHMLNKRLEQQRRAQVTALDGISCVQDSSVFGDTCFVEMLRKDGILSDAEVKVYSELFVNMTVDVMYPSMIVFLNCPPDVSLARIKKRGRGCETGISGDYVGKLNAEVKTLCDEFSRYTFVKEIDASVDLTEEEIESRARIIYDRLKMLREEPIVTRMGV